MLAGPYDGNMKMSLDALITRPGGGLLNILDFLIKGGAAKWGSDVTYVANDTIRQPYIFADTFTVSAAITLTLSPLMPLIVIADTFNINGTITGSGKGCFGSAHRCVPTSYSLFGTYTEEASATRNYCLCGAGGGSPGYVGGGAFGTGIAGAGPSCDLSAAEIEQLLLHPFFNVYQIGLGGSGSGVSTGAGAGFILLLGRIINVGSTGSILANGLTSAGGNSGGGGGGFVGLVGDALSVHGSAVLSAGGGAPSGTGYVGGDGIVAQIEV